MSNDTHGHSPLHIREGYRFAGRVLRAVEKVERRSNTEMANEFKYRNAHNPGHPKTHAPLPGMSYAAFSKTQASLSKLTKPRRKHG